MQKNKILRIIGFCIYLFLGYLVPGLVAGLFLISSISAIYTAVAYFIICCFLHFWFRKVARKIGLISKARIVWLERSLTIFGLGFWLILTFMILTKDVSLLLD